MTREVQDEGFLGRWARRKAQEKPGEKPGEKPQPGSLEEPARGPAAADEEARTAVPEGEVAPEDLPDPEALGRDDDWTPFLKRGVPPEIRTKALRRLWRLDPVFANLDGLVDYAEDYNGPQFTGVPVKTLFKVGRGMLIDEAPQDPQPQAEVADDIHPAPEETAELPAPDTGQPTGSPQLTAESAGPESADEPEVLAAAPVQDNPPRRRRALAKRWGIEAGADQQNR